MRLFSVGPKSLRSLDAYCVGSALPGNLLFPSVTCCFTKQETDRRGTGNLYTWIERTISVPGQYPFASRRTDELGWKVPGRARKPSRKCKIYWSMQVLPPKPGKS